MNRRVIVAYLFVCVGLLPVAHGQAENHQGQNFHGDHTYRSLEQNGGSQSSQRNAYLNCEEFLNDGGDGLQGVAEQFDDGVEFHGGGHSGPENFNQNERNQGLYELFCEPDERKTGARKPGQACGNQYADDHCYGKNVGDTCGDEGERSTCTVSNESFIDTVLCDCGS